MSSQDQPTVHWTGGSVAAMVSGIALACIGLVVLLGGLGLLVLHAAARDGDDYYTTGTERLATGAHALTVEDIDLGDDPVGSLPEDLLGRVRIRAERPDGRPVFVGIAREDDLAAYLRGVRRAEVTDFDPPEYEVRGRGAPPRPPGEETFWVASAEGSGRQAADWDVEGGEWSVVAMNADGSRRVVVDADVGAKVGWLVGAGIAALLGGLLSRPAGRPDRAGGAPQPSGADSRAVAERLQPRHAHARPGRRGARHQEALHERGAGGPDVGQLLGRLHALGHQQALGGAGIVGERVHQRHPARIGVDSAHQRTVELQVGGAQRGKLAEPGVAGAHVVHREADAALAKEARVASMPRRGERACPRSPPRSGAPGWRSGR